MKLLTLESTCDETAAAVVTGDLQILSSVVASQHDLHQRFGGVVPEIASRAHVERLLPTITAALDEAGIRLTDLDAIAVTNRPGLAGALLVGLAAAKALCVALDIPLLAVNHVEAHLFACQMGATENVFPAVGLVVSGGHTSLYRMHSALEFELLGSTLDDAAGESFDKVASLLGLPYPGGPAIEAAAQAGNPRAYRFPRSFLREERLDFSFSGLKTAVRYAVWPQGAEHARPLSESEIADLAASFQAAVLDVLVEKAFQAVQATSWQRLCVGGGVAANQALRQRLQERADQRGVALHLAPRHLTTDNAAMGALAVERLKAGLVEALDLDVYPTLSARQSVGPADAQPKVPLPTP